MLYAVIALGIICVALVIALAGIVGSLQESRRDAELAWTHERRELLNRIQAPERLPFQPSPMVEMPERAPDEWAKVGTVNIDAEKWGLSDE